MWSQYTRLNKIEAIRCPSLSPPLSLSVLGVALLVCCLFVWDVCFFVVVFCWGGDGVFWQQKAGQVGGIAIPFSDVRVSHFCAETGRTCGQKSSNRSGEDVVDTEALGVYRARPHYKIERDRAVDCSGSQATGITK